MRECIPYLSINASGLTQYLTWEGSRRNHVEKPSWQENFKDNKTGGVVSNAAGTKIKKAIDWLLATTTEKKVYDKARGKTFTFKTSFLTLTLASAQRHSDNEIKDKLLNQFFVEAKKKWKLNRYVWRAEAQQNGSIHFHILCDRYIPWHQLRQVWNRIQNKLGYVDRFAAEHGHYDPNSTDIHSVKNIKNLARYVAKYCTKNVYVLKDDHGQPVETTRVLELCKKANSSLIHCLKNGHVLASVDAMELFKEDNISFHLAFRQIEGRLWGVSQSLSMIKSACMVAADSALDIYNTVKKLYPKQVFSGDYFEHLSVKIWEWLPLFDNYAGNKIKNWVSAIRDKWVFGQESLILT